MTRKASLFPTGTALPSYEWDAGLKEPWHFDFDKQPVNDEKWTCIVTAAVQVEAQDEKCIQTYIQCVDTGLRKAVKIISMADVVKILKEPRKLEKPENQGKGLKPSEFQSPQIIELAAKFAIFSDVECKLPSDLMAAVLKYMILNLKNENSFAKRVAAVKERKIREQNIKAKFIRDLKPYEMTQEERKSSRKFSSNILDLEKPINDEPEVGPDLYIMLVDFYDALVFPELLRINVPFLAFLKISDTGICDFKRRSFNSLGKSDGFERKRLVINSFWEMLKEEQNSDFEKNMKFKNIAVLEYNPSNTQTEPKSNSFKDIFDELTWMQYSAYYIYRQHQTYLKELCVQRLVLSLEPLDLSKCEVYNKLCDALVTGESLTPLLVLYAIVEQVVAGVPETESVALEYEPQLVDLFPSKCESNVTTESSSNLTPSLVTPCKKCRDKKYENICEGLKKSFSTNSVSEKNEETESLNESSISPQRRYDDNSSHSSIHLNKSICSEVSISESLISKVMSEKKTEKEIRKEKKWKTPSFCFYGDFVSLQTYFCDSRLLQPESIIDRFLKKLEVSLVWKKYPELPPGERAFYNFHFFSFWKNSEDSEERLKLKILFTCSSLKLISIWKSNLFTGGEEKNSEISFHVGKEKSKALRIKLNKNSTNSREKKVEEEEEEENFNSFFLKTFIKKTNFLIPEKKITKMENVEGQSKYPLFKTEYDFQTSSEFIHKTRSHLKMFTFIQKINELSFLRSSNFGEIEKSSNIVFLPKHSQQSSEKVLFSLIDCSEISNLTEHNFFRKKEDLTLIQDYKFYEKLNSSLMIQRLIEAQKDFNTVQCSYFPPTDNLIVIMHNDCDDRGIFFFEESGALSTPVSFRDFYGYVYPKIKKWLINENKEYLKFVSEIKERKKEEEEKKDLKYWAQLRKKYCEMSEEKREEFLETNVEVQIEPEVSEKELGDLCVKPKPQNSEKISFVATNFIDTWVETNQKIYEFFSSDGTEVKAAVETWLYAPLKLQKLKIKKSKLLLQYYQWLNVNETNFSFTLKTTSDIIFSFYKDDSEEMDNFNYHVTISWPTGLLIKPIFHCSNTYIKQTYLKTYRRGWDIEGERSRCFLKNGQVLIFRENGDYEILHGSGTKYAFNESGVVSKCEITSTTGEIWEVRSSGPCKNKKSLIGTHKILIGVDPKTQETFCRREDGVFLMLWQNGTLVTNYPDGTKITSVPYFEEKEVTTEWTEEEKLYYEELEMKYRSEISVQEPRSKTILRNISVPKSIERKSFIIEGFVSVLCAYALEHPKYATVYFNPEDPYIKMKLPEQLSILIYPDGNYEVQQEKDFLKVRDSTVQFYTFCDDCKDQSTITLYFDSQDVLCSCVDFSKKAFFVLRTGLVKFKKFFTESPDEGKEHDSGEIKEKSESTLIKCATGHNKKMALMQRCFALERNLNGMEFIHADTLGVYCHHLPEETYFDINTDDPINISCTFSSPYYKIGYEKWVMDYENVENSLPKNIKKKDLKELGVKETQKKLFKYPFPRLHPVDRQQNEKPKRVTNMPKFIIGRTIRCLCEEPCSVISDMQQYVATYQKRAEELYKTYKSHKITNEKWQEFKHVDMRLRKIAVALNQNLQMYPHLGTQFPSTEKDIHYFGHFINSMDDMKDRLQDDDNILPDCKQIPKPLPRTSDLPDIYEEIEPLQNT